MLWSCRDISKQESGTHVNVCLEGVQNCNGADAGETPACRLEPATPWLMTPCHVEAAIRALHCLVWLTSTACWGRKEATFSPTGVPLG